MTLDEARSAVCSKLNINYADVQAGNNALFSLADLNEFVNSGAGQAWDYKPWTFTEGVKSLIIPSPIPPYYDYPSNFEDESIEFIAVNGVPWIGENNGKRTYLDFQKWFSDYPTDMSLIWTEKARFIFLNTNAIAIGQTMDAYGKLRRSQLVSSTDLLPFSPLDDGDENSGNDAITHLAYAHAMQSEKKKAYAQAAQIEKDALAMLDNVWKPLGERKAQKQGQNKPFFNTNDNYRGWSSPFNTNIGNFP